MGKDGRQSTYGCADLHSTTTATTHHWTTRREGSRGGVAWRIQASTSQEREGPAPAPALALAGGLVPGRARFGISRGVCWGSSACAAWGRLAGRSQPPATFRRSVAPSPSPLPHRTCFVYKFSRPRPLIFTSSAILPAVAGSAGRGPEWQTWGSDGEGRPTELLLLPVRGSACQCCQVSQLWLSSRHVGSAAVKVK